MDGGESRQTAASRVCGACAQGPQGLHPGLTFSPLLSLSLPSPSLASFPFPPPAEQVEAEREGRLQQTGRRVHGVC